MALTDSFTCEGDAGVKLLLSVETVMCETCECMSAVVIGFALQTLSAKVASSCREQLGSSVAKRSCISAGSFCRKRWRTICIQSVSYTHLRAHETPEHLVCRLLLEKKKK